MTDVKHPEGQWVAAKQIALVDENDVPRVVIGLSMDGEPAIAVLDAAGEIIRCTTLMALTAAHGEAHPTIELKPGLMPQKTSTS